MPSQLHEACFSEIVIAAPLLLRDALHVELPEYTEARIDSADLTDIHGRVSRRSRGVAQRRRGDGIVWKCSFADERQVIALPAYVANLRATFGCPVCLFVVTPDEAVPDGI